MTQGRVLGFIPAKGGSTRFPRKNIAMLEGRPLLAWAVEAARKSGVIDSVAISSEDPEVLACARGLGVEHVLERPAHLARDPAGIVDVALHEIDVIEKNGERYETLVILAPCAPLRTAEDIQAAYRLFETVRPSFVMSVSEFSHTPFAALVVDDHGHLEPAFPDLFGRKSQAMPRAYRPNGAIHVLDTRRFRETRDYLTPPRIPYIMPRERSIDVDHPEDLEAARIILSRQRPGVAGGSGA
jgi:CMP-N-acetylneuraminic acid synthetase